jgi:hypothetical protein
VLYALAAYYFHANQLKDARIWADKLRQVQPGDQRLVNLERALDRRLAD